MKPPTLIRLRPSRYDLELMLRLERALREDAEDQLAITRLCAALQGAVLCMANVEHPSDIHPLWCLVTGEEDYE